MHFLHHFETGIQNSRAHEPQPMPSRKQTSPQTYVRHARPLHGRLSAWPPDLPCGACACWHGTVSVTSLMSELTLLLYDVRLQSQGQLTIDQQGLVWRRSGGGRKVELAKRGVCPFATLCIGACTVELWRIMLSCLRVSLINSWPVLQTSRD